MLAGVRNAGSHTNRAAGEFVALLSVESVDINTGENYEAVSYEAVSYGHCGSWLWRPQLETCLNPRHGFAARVGFAAVAMPRRPAAGITWAMPLVRALPSTDAVRLTL